jgi:4-phospho-D-threonate 3-dehydrogenase / 4-phospho-D-erythronate 3-dehydrogenase
MTSTPPLPKLALTMGDVAGIGPEVIVRALSDLRCRQWCRPVVVGHPRILQRAVELVGVPLQVISVDGPAAADAVTQPDTVACWNPGADAAADVPPGVLDPRSGQAAYEYLTAAVQAALAGEVDAITTAPLNKAALHRAGWHYPGHTEILAEACGVDDFAMMLYLPPGAIVRSPQGLGVAHVTLHTSIRSVPDLLSTAAIREKFGLIAGFMSQMGCPKPRIAVCALNPHAGEDGLFGDEEARLIAPAVAQAAASGIDVAGPLPADTLFARAVAGEFDGVTAMYHDQGHIAFKLIGFDQAVNVTLGLPIVRTSPSHGTAFDIAWKGQARADGMLAAMQVAARLAREKSK